jgi:hypothetical protein
VGVGAANRRLIRMKRRGWQIGREQTRRLMRHAGRRGVQRGKPVFVFTSGQPIPDQVSSRFI